MAVGTKGFKPTKTVSISGLSVCIVDDDPDHLMITGRLLKDCEARVSAFSSGKEALEFLTTNQVDIVISDVMMPEVDGWSFFSSLRQLPGHVQTPVIFVTCLLEAPDEPLFNDKGDRCKVLSKPLRHKQLLETMSELI